MSYRVSSWKVHPGSVEHAAKRSTAAKNDLFAQGLLTGIDSIPTGFPHEKSHLQDVPQLTPPGHPLTLPQLRAALMEVEGSPCENVLKQRLIWNLGDQIGRDEMDAFKRLNMNGSGSYKCVSVVELIWANEM